MARSDPERPSGVSSPAPGVEPESAHAEQDLVVRVAGAWGPWQACPVSLPGRYLKRMPGSVAVALSPILQAEQWRGQAWFHEPLTLDLLQEHAVKAETDSCHAYDWDAAAAVPCTHWQYNRTVFVETIVSEWDLVCSRQQLANVAQLVLMFGVLVGNVLFGAAADRWGRRLPLMAAIVLQAAAGVATAFVPWLAVFMVLRFLVAVATGGTMVVSFVICMEIVGGPWRTVVPILYQIPFSVGVSMMAGVAYYLRHWRDFQLALGAFSVPFIAYYWFIPESPRWLLAVGREEEAHAILEAAAKTNGRDVGEAKAALLDHRAGLGGHGGHGDGQPRAGLGGLMRTPRLRRMSLCLFFTWFVVGLGFFGFSQFQGQIGGDIFVNVALSGLISIPGPIICAYLVRVMGRRACILFSLIMSSAASLLIIAVIPAGVFPGDWPRSLLAGLAVLGMSITFPALYLFSGELLPTVVRNVGLGASSMCARVGSMAAPFVLALSAYGDYVPLVTLGGLPLVGAMLMLPLPETRDCVLPDSLEDGENFCRRRAKEDMKNANYIQVPLKDLALAEGT
ncbi:organic cation transporter protein-like [Thrips palmi]|uniref:Organic cation transporter protein-like n=1 Tax=Thrips palmi TaxID=161013 RepID=A0A6P9ACZ6_THRPL|nr:organic cation transporter protein-like [Thrips palmi]